MLAVARVPLAAIPCKNLNLGLSWHVAFLDLVVWVNPPAAQLALAFFFLKKIHFQLTSPSSCTCKPNVLYSLSVSNGVRSYFERVCDHLNIKSMIHLCGISSVLSLCVPYRQGCSLPCQCLHNTTCACSLRNRMINLTICRYISDSIFSIQHILACPSHGLLFLATRTSIIFKNFMIRYSSEFWFALLHPHGLWLQKVKNGSSLLYFSVHLADVLTVQASCSCPRPESAQSVHSSLLKGWEM